MKTYRQIVDRLGFQKVCLGQCGVAEAAHRRGAIDGFDIVHWGDRRVNRRGLRRLFLLVARRDRLLSPDFLNDEGLYFIHFYLDERKANEWAAQIGVRFPISYSTPERRTVSLVPGLSRSQPAVYAWARRAE